MIVCCLIYLLLLSYRFEHSFACYKTRETAVINEHPWSNWSHWSACSNTLCGLGVKQRKRFNELDMKQVEIEDSSCVSKIDCVYGEWKAWQPWSECSARCSGEQQRLRDCFLRTGAVECKGSKIEMRMCNLPPCNRYYPKWLTWSSWTICTTTCGDGTRSRNRGCDYSNVDLRDMKTLFCIGNTSEIAACDNPDCLIVIPQWQSWGTWSDCQSSATCGNGTRARTRVCVNTKPGYLSVPSSECHGEASEYQVCPLLKCPILPEWSSWKVWSACSASCGAGTRRRTRERDCPTDAEFCNGAELEDSSCQVKPCPPIDGSWSSWQAWSACMATCGTSTQTRIRYCNSPAPSNGGIKCVGEAADWRHCLGGTCPVDGAWGTWSECSSSAGSSSCTTPTGGCEAGRRRFCRNCDNPKPEFGGTACFTGSPIKDDVCWNHAACDNSIVTPPLNLKLIGYVDSNSLTVQWTRPPYGLKIHDFLVEYFVIESSGGKKNLTILVNEDQILGQRYSITLTEFSKGQLVQVTVFSRHKKDSGSILMSSPSSQNFRISRVDGRYGQWGPWSICSKQCDFGSSTRTRECNDPPPSNDGLPCQGEAQETKPCRLRLC